MLKDGKGEEVGIRWLITRDMAAQLRISGFGYVCHCIRKHEVVVDPVGHPGYDVRPGVRIGSGR